MTASGAPQGRSGCRRVAAAGSLLVAAAFTFIGCSGCGSDKSGAPARTLRWEPPRAYADGQALDASKDLAGYEIYVNETGTFSAADTARAFVRGTDPPAGAPVTSFDLSKCVPPLQPGRKYYLSMKSVDREGVRSDLALPPVLFTY